MTSRKAVVLTREQEAALLGQCRDAWLEKLVRIMILTGLREREARRCVEKMPDVGTAFRVFRAAASRAGLPKRTSWHDLRLTWLARTKGVACDY